MYFYCYNMGGAIDPVKHFWNWEQIPSTLLYSAELLYPSSEKTAQFWADGQKSDLGRLVFLVIIKVQVG